ncbi:MAG: orotidine 5'-phosphate decarboxylase / HUMPS family protein [Candidatus Micrarchaeota archaeon]
MPEQDDGYGGELAALSGLRIGGLRRFMAAGGRTSRDRLKHKTRYLQIAFNDDLASAYRIIPLLPRSDRILVEAGTPFVKRYGSAGIRAISSLWEGKIVADLKTMDGAEDEVRLAASAGATAATVLGAAAPETLNLFIGSCETVGMDSMIDMIGVEEPLAVLRKLRRPPKVIVLHRGRDEETTRGKAIKYKHISKIRSKFDVLISAAGGVDLHEARSAIFNGSDIVVVNIVPAGSPWTGIGYDEDVATVARQFLGTIE